MASSSTPTDILSKKVRKPYTITKSRESWTDEEHDKFIEALQLFDRDWKKIEDYVGSKTVIQIRSHAQKYFLKVQKNGTIAHVPPPRPKRKAIHPYPHKTLRYALEPFQASMAYVSNLSSFATGNSPWHETSVLTTTTSDTNIFSQDDYADVGVGGEETIGNPSGMGSSSEILLTLDIPKQGIPDFAEVYGFIGSVFDPETTGHMQKLEDMDPINFETVLLLMRNLTLNLSSPEFEPIRNILSSYDIDTETRGMSRAISLDQTEDDQPC